MFDRACRACCSWAEGEVVEILEGRGVRRAKVVSAGALVEVAALGDREIHLGDRIALAGSVVIAHRVAGVARAGDMPECADDPDLLPWW
jgi:hypothetical protein